MAATARAVDLTGVKEGGVFRPKRKPEGDYRAKIVKADDHQPKDKTKGLGWVLTIQVEGDARSTYPYYLSPEDNQLWKISGICRAAGLNVKNARIKFDPNKLVNRALGVLLEDDEFDGKVKSTIGDVFPVSEVGANADEDVPDGDEVEDDEEIVEDEEPEPVKAPARRRKPAPEPEPEEEEYEDEPEPEPAPVRRRRKPAPEPVEDDVEDDEEPTPAPVRRRRAAAPAPAKKAARPIARARTAEPEDDDDLDELDVDDLD